jgi:hypothetical protein
MKKVYSLTLAFLLFSILHAQFSMDFYLPTDISYDPRVPTPASVIGYVPGEWHISHDQTVQYFQQLAVSSDRVTYLEYGRTYQNRPLFHVIITSPENHQNLETIRTNHLALADPSRSGNTDISRMPVIVRLGYGVHGNESSAHNAAPIVAYFYAAAQGKEIDDLLKNTVILLDPSLNPDGQQRFSTWVNNNRSITPVADPNDREFREVWPGSRTNHYWFDLNRDWILAQHPESRGRLTFYHSWKPNVNTDHHEFGANASFFFQPGVPSRINPLTPKRTNELTQALGEFHAKALDQLGALYFTEEVFDDFYYGKGSSYPDANGSIGILYEQAGMKGHVRETIHGIVEFPYTVRNQVAVSFSTVNGSYALRTELLDHLKSFYTSALDLAAKEPVKAWIFGESNDNGKMRHFFDILQLNQIDVYEIKSSLSIGDHSFEPGNAWMIPLDQPQFRIIQSLFQTTKTFEDSIFYDISTWTLPLAFNIPYTGITTPRQAESLKGEKTDGPEDLRGSLKGGPSEIGYVFSWEDYYAAKALYAIQDQGIRTKTATGTFSISTEDGMKDFSYGSIFVQSSQQRLSPEEIYKILMNVAEATGIDLYAVSSGLSQKGIDMGSGSFLVVEKPEVLLLIGDGISGLEAGEIWHLLDQRFKMPVTKLEASRTGSTDLSRYNTIIMPGGNYAAIDESGRNKLEEWLRNGGTLIAQRTANNWLNSSKITRLNFLQPSSAQTSEDAPYDMRNEIRRSRNIPGSIFEHKIDITHPLGYGYTRSILPMFKSGGMAVERSENPFANPVKYTGNPLLSGYAHPSLLESIQGSASVIVQPVGRGNVISMVDNPNFRAFWFGTNKLFMNAIFFGKIIGT